MRNFARVLGLGLIIVLLGTLAIGVAGAQDEVVLVLGVDQEPERLSPLNSLVQGGALEAFYARNVWDWDTERNIYPIMVEEIPSVDNGMITENEAGNTVVTYKLREGMLWSDGEPITSADCEFGHLLYTDASTSANIGRAEYANSVESFEVIDDLTFNIVYNQPFPDYAATEFANARCRYPNHVLRPILEADGNIDQTSYFTDGEGVVGYGPYRLAEWNKGESIVFEKNEFWDGQEPAIDRVIIRYIFETAQMQNAFATGEIDLTYLFADPQVPEYEGVPGAVIWSVPAVLADALWVNTAAPGHPALHDVRVREAIAYALDRPAMAEGIIGAGTQVPLSWYPPALTFEGHPYREYDVERANALLDEAGWVDSNGSGTRDKDGVELVLRFYTTTRQDRMDYQLLVQEYLNAVGIGTQPVATSATILFGNFSARGFFAAHDFDIALFANSARALSPSGDPDTFSCAGIGSAENPDGFNGMSWCNPEYDELDAQISRTIDPEERMELVAQAQQLFYDGAFWHGLHLRKNNFAVNGDRWNADTFTEMGTLTNNFFQKVEFWEPAS